MIAYVQESHLLAPGLRFPGPRSSKVCWNSPKPGALVVPGWSLLYLRVRVDIRVGDV